MELPTEAWTPIQIRNIARSQNGVIERMLLNYADVLDGINRAMGSGETYPQVTIDQAFNKLLRKLSAADLSNVEALQFTQAYLNLAHAKVMLESANKPSPLTATEGSQDIDQRILDAFNTVALNVPGGGLNKTLHDILFRQ